MKKLAPLFSLFGFIIQYVCPVVIFGDIVPFTREGVGRCLTGMGYMAIALVLFFATKKIKEWLLQKPKSITRGLLLSVFPIVWWVAVAVALDFLGATVISLTNYWSRVIVFILIGRGCYVVAEALAVEEGDKK